jgi:hypothetical protein
MTRILGEWEGYQIGTVGRFEGGQKGPTALVWFELVPIPGRPMFWNGCGQATPEVHETTERWGRDLCRSSTLRRTCWRPVGGSSVRPAVRS